MLRIAACEVITADEFDKHISAIRYGIEKACRSFKLGLLREEDAIEKIDIAYYRCVRQYLDEKRLKLEIIADNLTQFEEMLTKWNDKHDAAILSDIPWLHFESNIESKEIYAMDEACSSDKAKVIELIELFHIKPNAYVYGITNAHELLQNAFAETFRTECNEIGNTLKYDWEKNFVEKHMHKYKDLFVFIEP